MGAPEAKAIMRADNRRLRSDLAKSRKMFAGTFTKIGSKIRGALSSSLGALGVGGGIAGFAAIGRSVIGFEDTLSRLEIQSGASAAKMATIRASMIDLSKATGISRGEVAGAAKALVDLFGGAALTTENIKLLTDANLATGASMEDLAGLSLTLQNAFGLVGAQQLEQGLSAVAQAGKEGSIPISEMASALRKVGAIFSDVSGGGPRGAAQLSAAMQVLAAQGFANADDSATGLSRAMLAIQTRSKQLKKLGVDVFQKDGKTFKDLPDIVAQLDSAGVSIASLKAAGFDIRAARGLAALAKGSEEFKELSSDALKINTIQIDKLKRQRSVVARLNKGFNNLKETLIETLTPERLELFIEGLTALGKTIGFMIDNAKIFAGIWLTIKLGGIAAQAQAVAAATQAAAGSSATMATNFGAATKAFGALSALVAGFTVGTIVDQALGLSDKISDEALTTESKSFQETGFLRERSEDVGRSRFLQQAGFGAQVDPAQQLQAARNLLSSSRAAGVLDGDKVDPLQAAKVAFEGNLDPALQRGIRSGDTTIPAQEQLTRNIRAAQELVAQAGKPQRVEVVVRVEQDGSVSASGSGSVE